MNILFKQAPRWPERAGWIFPGEGKAKRVAPKNKQGSLNSRVLQALNFWGF